MTPAENIAADIWRRLEQAQTLNVRLGEETLSDLLILDLRRWEDMYNFRVLQTTKHKEAVFGTDLEVIVRAGSSSARRYAIQAKKLYSRGGSGRGGYDTRKKAGNSGRLQLDVLEDYARNIGAIPYYMFYNFALDSGDYWHCCKNYDEAQLGCTMVPSWIVRAAVHFRCRKFEFMHEFSEALPWRCLFNCAEWEGGLEDGRKEVSKLRGAGADFRAISRPGWVNVQPIEEARPIGLAIHDAEDGERIAEQYLENREPIYLPRNLLFIDKIAGDR